MTIMYSKDPVTGQTVQKVIQYVKDPSTQKMVEQQSWNVPSGNTVDLTGKGATLVTTTQAIGVKGSVPTTQWEDTAKVIQGFEDLLLG